MESLNLWSYNIMSKVKKQKKQADQVEKIVSNSDTVLNKYKFSQNKLLLAFLIFIGSFGIYANSIQNEYALDDIMVYTSNKLVQSGSEGFSELWTKDFLYGYRGFQSMDLAGSRWRPLSLISFAIDVELWGNNPHWSHFENVLLYAIACVLLFYLLSSFLFPDQALFSFIGVIVFSTIPIHTEVVANIKSRDEILCFLFLISGLISILKWKNLLGKLLFVLCIFLSLLAKENAVPFLAGLPLLLFYFTNKTAKEILKDTFLLLGIISAYFVIRLQIIPMAKLEASKEILNNPFMQANAVEAFATKIFLLAYSIFILMIPFKLSHDYSYNHFAYLQPTDWRFILSLIVLIVCSVGSIYYLKKRNLFAFAWMLFILLYSISTNLVIEIGTPLAERLLFLPSIAVCFAIIGLMQFLQKYKKEQVGILLFSVLATVYSVISLQRNKDWKNDDTLSLADFPKCPKSIRLANRAATAYINLSADSNISASKKSKLLVKSISICKTALKIHPNYNDMLSNIGVAYSRMDSLDTCEMYWKMFEKIDPGNPKLNELHHFLFVRMYNKGLSYGSIKPDSALYWFDRAYQYAKTENNPNYWYDFAGANYMQGNFKRAVEGFTQTLKLAPGKREAAMGLQAAKQKSGIKL